MRAILFGANGAMGKLISDLLGNEIVGKVSIDGDILKKIRNSISF